MKRLEAQGGFCGTHFHCERITSHMIDDCEQIRYTTYGIRLTDCSGNILDEIPDISTDKEKVDEFVRLCRVHEVAALHMYDVLEDYLD